MKYIIGKEKEKGGGVEFWCVRQLSYMSALLKSDRKLNCSVGVSRSVLCLFITEVRVLERKTPRRKVRTTSWRLVFIHRFEYSTTKLGGGRREEREGIVTNFVQRFFWKVTELLIANASDGFKLSPSSSAFISGYRKRVGATNAQPDSFFVTLSNSYETYCKWYILVDFTINVSFLFWNSTSKTYDHTSVKLNTTVKRKKERLA